VYQLRAERKLAHARLGAKRGAIRITERNLQAFLGSCQVPPSDPPKDTERRQTASGSPP